MLKSKDFINKEMLSRNRKDEKEKNDIDSSKKYQESNSIPMQREQINLSLDMIENLVIGLSTWKTWALKNDFEIPEKSKELENISIEILKSYLSSFISGKGISGNSDTFTVQIRYLLKKFRERSRRDDFIMQIYSPMIFLKRYSGVLQKLAVSYKVFVYEHRKKPSTDFTGIFPKSTRLREVDVAKESQRKAEFILKQEKDMKKQ